MHKSFHPVLVTFEKVFSFMVDDIKNAFFKDQISNEDFVASMISVSNIAVKVMSLKQSHTVILSPTEFELVKLSFTTLIAIHKQTELTASAYKDTQLSNEISELTQALEVFKAHICISDVSVMA